MATDQTIFDQHFKPAIDQAFNLKRNAYQIRELYNFLIYVNPNPKKRPDLYELAISIPYNINHNPILIDQLNRRCQVLIEHKLAEILDYPQNTHFEIFIMLNNPHQDKPTTIFVIFNPNLVKPKILRLNSQILSNYRPYLANFINHSTKNLNQIKNNNNSAQAAIKNLIFYKINYDLFQYNVDPKQNNLKPSFSTKLKSKIKTFKFQNLSVVKTYLQTQPLMQLPQFKMATFKNKKPHFGFIKAADLIDFNQTQHPKIKKIIIKKLSTQYPELNEIHFDYKLWFHRNPHQKHLDVNQIDLTIFPNINYFQPKTEPVELKPQEIQKYQLPPKNQYLIVRSPKAICDD